MDFYNKTIEKPRSEKKVFCYFCYCYVAMRLLGKCDELLGSIIHSMKKVSGLLLFIFLFLFSVAFMAKNGKRVFCIFKVASAPEPPKKVESRAESRAAQSSKFNYTSLYQCQLNTCLHLPHLFRRSEFFHDFDAGSTCSTSWYKFLPYVLMWRCPYLKC